MKKLLHKLIEKEDLTPETFVLHFERNGFVFSPGQYVILRNPETGDGREYSIYSSLHDRKLSFLVREVEGGDFSRFLRHLKPGSTIGIEGPRGFFVLDEQVKSGHPALFIASGTGISPFHSFVRSYPDMNYTVLHGVHFADEAYGKEAFKPYRFCLCTSREESGNYFGRVTYYLKENPVDPETICYLCGNSDMIEEVTGILESYGVSPENIRSEVFF
ncbi:ferredoxin--NADP reductase [Gaoshiqia sp. Z1-71]|uniref:ferredoxin--NADP reductase n=1 Tax=Gaoshiqia hydrogeniformans TaxID=3290090 RepID=UPI003BF8E4C1